MSERGPFGGTGDGGRLVPDAPGAALLSTVEAYWARLRGDRLLPLRSEVDPRGLGDAIDGTFVIQRMAPAPARIRMAGAYADAIMGMEIRGMPLAALFSVAERPRLGALIEAVFTRPEALRLTLAAPAEGGRPPLRAGMVLLPLLSDLGDATRALGCLAGEPTERAAPRRFEITSIHRRDLLTEGTAPAPPLPRLSPPARPAAVRAGRLRPVTPGTWRPGAIAAAPGFAEPAAPAPRPPRRKPVLRVIRGDGGGPPDGAGHGQDDLPKPPDGGDDGAA